MPRPTQEDLAWAVGALEELAQRHCPHDDPRNETGWPDVVTLLSLFVNLDVQIHNAREAAAYGPGAEGGYRTLHKGGTSADLYAKANNDLLLKQLRGLSRSSRHKLGQLVDEIRQDYETLVGKQGIHSG